MDSMILSVLSVILFCFFAHFFLKSILSPMPYFQNNNYSKTALRVKKVYKVFSFGVLTFVFMIALVVSFYQVYNQI